MCEKENNVYILSFKKFVFPSQNKLKYNKQYLHAFPAHRSSYRGSECGGDGTRQGGRDIV